MNKRIHHKCPTRSLIGKNKGEIRVEEEQRVSPVWENEREAVKRALVAQRDKANNWNNLIFEIKQNTYSSTNLSKTNSKRSTMVKIRKNFVTASFEKYLTMYKKYSVLLNVDNSLKITIPELTPSVFKC